MGDVTLSQGAENGHTAGKLRVSVEPAPIAGATAAATSKRLFNGVQVNLITSSCGHLIWTNSNTPFVLHSLSSVQAKGKPTSTCQD